MNKMKKLLSVLLAFVIALSCMSVTASAAVAQYKTVDQLTGMSAYSPYGAVTRLDTEERLSIVFDFLDGVLENANIQIAPIDLSVLGTLNIDLGSLNGVLKTVDNVQSLLGEGFSGFLVGLVGGLLGIIGDLEFGTWQSGMTREGTANKTILRELFELLQKNRTTLADALRNRSIDLGSIIGGMVDISVVNDVLADLPGLIKGLIFPMFERWDDTLAEVKAYDTASQNDGGVVSTLNTFVKSLFSNDMSITTVKYDASGNMTSEHTKMPFSTTVPSTPAEGNTTAPRCVYVMSAGVPVPGTTLTVYHIVDAAEAKALAKTPDKDNGSPAAYTYFEEAQKYVMTEEVEGSGTYVWQATDEWGNKWSLKWYNDNSPFLPGFSGDDFDLTTMTLAELLYKFIPPVFANMAPVVLNGSVKKILAEFFGAQFTYVGLVGDDAVNALPDASNAFFTEEQGEYLWEWSNYAVINGNHYYRFEDQIYAGDISNTNNYFDIIDWGFEITTDFMNEFIPSDGKGSASNTLLMNLNNFLIKVAEEITLPSATTTNEADGKTAEWTRPTFTKGGNENLVANIKAAAQKVISLAPQHIFGSDYDTNPKCYYDLLMSNDNQTILTGLAATIVDALMPQMLLPNADDLMAQKTNVGAILAAVLRELATQLIPDSNYDALIYTNYNTKQFVANKDNSYWLDVIMTMGVDIGIHYLHNLQDLGQDDATAMANLGWSGARVYSEADLLLNADIKLWEKNLDYIIDWALEKDYEWTWKMENLVDTTGLTVDINTDQDPWKKLDHIIDSLFPVINELLTINTTDCETELEQALRYNLILGLVDLEWTKLTNMVVVPDASVGRTTNALQAITDVLKTIVNGLFAKVGGGSYKLIPDSMTTLDGLANQSNLADLVEGLLNALPTAVDKGLLDTVAPFLNFFIGWKTSPQVYADPTIKLVNGSGYDYIYTGATNTLSVANTASGMLETHRVNHKTLGTNKDSDYTLKVIGVTSDDGTITSTASAANPVVVIPGGKADIALTVSSTTPRTVVITISYQFVGKDGQPLGGTQNMQVYQYVSSAEPETVTAKNTYNIFWEREDKPLFSTVKTVVINIDVAAPKYFVFDDNFSNLGTVGATYTSNGEFSAWIEYINFSGVDSRFTYNEEMYEHGRTEPEVDAPGWVNQGKVYSLYPFSLAEGFNIDEIKSGSIIDLGNYEVMWYNKVNKTLTSTGTSGNNYDNETVDSGDIYFRKTGDLKSALNSYAQVKRADFANATDAQWNAFVAAMKEIATLIYKPFVASTFAADYGEDNLKAKVEAVETAHKALVDAENNTTNSSDAEATSLGLEALKAALDRDTSLTGYEINYQDYDLYEYFKYQDYRTANRNLLKSLEAPEVMDRYYILNSGIRQAELDAVIEAESNPFIAAGITASRLENKQEDIDASQKAHDEFIAPSYTDLYYYDQASKLDWYRGFLVDASVGAVANNNDSLYFLDKEIKYADEQNYVEANYTVATWAEYEEAYDYAKAVLAGTAENATLPSTVFEAKYNLMVAEKQLLLKENSLIEKGGTAALEANIITAEAIFASLAAGDGAWALKEGVDADKAYAELISALGYYYTGEDGNEWNLYADSAYEYRDNDRPNRQANQAKVNKSNAALEAAIANFEVAAADPELVLTDKGLENAAVISATQCTGDGFTGSLFGVETLGFGYNEKMTLEQAYETDAGYIKVDTTNSNGKETTGAVVKLYTDKDELVGTYVFVYFGDVNKDGDISLNDATLISEYYGWVSDIDSEAGLMAADSNGDKDVNLNDATLISEYYGWISDMPEQADLAKTYA